MNIISWADFGSDVTLKTSLGYYVRVHMRTGEWLYLS